MKRAVLIFSLFFLTIIYSEPLVLAKEKRVYYCCLCGLRLSSSQIVLQMFVGINQDNFLCDECRKEKNKGKGGKPQQAILKYTGCQGEIYSSGYPTQEESAEFLENYKKMKQYQKQNFINVVAGGYHLRVSKGGSDLIIIGPYSAEPYKVMAPVKRKGPDGKIEYHKIVEVIPLEKIFLLFPDQKDTHDIYKFDPSKNKKERFMLLKEQKLIGLLDDASQSSKKSKSVEQKQDQYVKEYF